MNMRSRLEGPKFPGAPVALALGLVLTLAGVTVPGADETPTLVITNSVLLSWPARSSETNVVVVATSIEGPWVPLLEPTFRRLNELCVAVPTTATQRFYRLKPGFQVFDDASGVPVAWEYEADPGVGHEGMTLTHTNGAVRVRSDASKAEMCWYWPQGAPTGLVDPPSQEEHRDFACSIDILDWGAGINSNVSLTGRATWPDALYSACYGAIDFTGGMADSLFIDIDYGDATFVRSSPCRMTRGKAYRLVFTGVGDRFTLELFEINGASAPVASLTATSDKVPSGVGMPPGFHGGGVNGDVTLDNLRFVGVRP
jgi:hypothetical protein